MNPQNPDLSVADARAALAAQWLSALDLPPWAQAAVALAVLALLATATYFVAKHWILRGMRALVRRSRMDWDDVVFESRVPQRAGGLLPLLVFLVGIDFVPGLTEDAAGFLRRMAAAGLIVGAAATLDALLTALHLLYNRLPAGRTRPIKNWVQLARVFLYALAGIFVVARLADQSPWYFVSGLGAMMAVILLIFRDTLLSLVAGVQLTSNDLVRVGDWIEVPDFEADGDVVDIALNTVKVQNWDRTVTVIPTHKFLDHSFRNWRNMFEGGGRRIKRALHIDTSTIRFLTEDEVDRFSRFALLKDYVAAKRAELAEHNARVGAEGMAANARRLTNVGTLRAYIAAYLKNHPLVRQDLTVLVRQLAPGPEGLPIEVYVFSAETRWVHFEAIQSDLFDHLLAMVPEFGLRVYQRPSGADLGAALEQGAWFPLPPRIGAREQAQAAD